MQSHTIPGTKKLKKRLSGSSWAPSTLSAKWNPKEFLLRLYSLIFSGSQTLSHQSQQKKLGPAFCTVWAGELVNSIQFLTSLWMFSQIQCTMNLTEMSLKRQQIWCGLHQSGWALDGSKELQFIICLLSSKFCSSEFVALRIVSCSHFYPTDRLFSRITRKSQ